MPSPNQKWTHLISPGEFNKLPHLFCVSTEWVDDPAYSCDIDYFRPHEHLCIFKYTVEGFGFATYGGTTYKVEPGQALIFSKRVPGASFYYPPGETKPWKFIECEFCNTQEIVEQLDARHGPVYDLGADHFLVKKLISLTGEQSRRDTMISGTENFRICTDIIEEMCRIVEMKDAGEDGSLAIKARNLIYQERTKEFSLPELSKQIGISPGHLCREFKKQFNDTPKHYYNQLRLKLIIEQLINTEKPLKKLAEEFGFKSAPSFNAFFKKHSAGTPGQIRRNRSRNIRRA